jgi:hypothetical protein
MRTLQTIDSISTLLLIKEMKYLLEIKLMGIDCFESLVGAF